MIKRLILSDGVKRAVDYIRSQGWSPDRCVIATTPEQVKGIEGPGRGGDVSLTVLSPVDWKLITTARAQGFHL